MTIELPVGTNTPRPIGPTEGMMRPFYSEDEVGVDIYRNGQWEELVRKPRTEDDYDIG